MTTIKLTEDQHDRVANLLDRLMGDDYWGPLLRATPKGQRVKVAAGVLFLKGLIGEERGDA